VGSVPTKEYGLVIDVTKLVDGYFWIGTAVTDFLEKHPRIMSFLLEYESQIKQLVKPVALTRLSISKAPGGTAILNLSFPVDCSIDEADDRLQNLDQNLFKFPPGVTGLLKTDVTFHWKEPISLLSM
jgi:hypothetical protein